jgi:c-di-GMP-binding flagellar brake protein YcgR
MSGFPFRTPILLQSEYKFFQEADTRTIWIFGIIVAAFLVLLVIGSVISRRRNAHLSPEQRKKYNRFVFARMAREAGLQKEHVEILDYLIRTCRVMQPFLIFSSPGLLDDMLRKGIYSLEKNTELAAEERERQLSVIYQIKQIIEQNSRKGTGIRSTSLLKPGQPMVIHTEIGGHHPTQVVSSMKNMLACTTARNSSGQELRWQKGTQLKISFWRENDAGYVFQTKTLGYDAVKGRSCVLIQHAKILRQEQRRKFRRRALERACFFSPVQIVESGEGRNRKLKAVVQGGRQRIGTVLDISAGGCSIASLTPLPAGSLIKVDFDLSRGVQIGVFGKVCRFREERRQGGVMNVKFTKVSGKHLNHIYSYVYNYTSPQSALQRPG